jgi:Domain of unknown function (DUF5069)
LLAKSKRMNATAVPRRWNVEVDGIRWLPRLIDKARMRARGALGAYLLGHSPVDHGFLTRAGLTTEQFAALVRPDADDAAVLAALRRHDGWDEARIRRWSERFPTTYRAYIPLWDIDEGYLVPNAWQAMGLRIYRPFEGAAMGLVRRVRRAP